VPLHANEQVAWPALGATAKRLTGVDTPIGLRFPPALRPHGTVPLALHGMTEAGKGVDSRLEKKQEEEKSERAREINLGRTHGASKHDVGCFFPTAVLNLVNGLRRSIWREAPKHQLCTR